LRDKRAFLVVFWHQKLMFLCIFGVKMCKKRMFLLVFEGKNACFFVIFGHFLMKIVPEIV